MEKTMLTCETLDRFEKNYKTKQYNENQTKKIEFAAYVANMNRCENPEWTNDDVFTDFLRVLDIDGIKTEKVETAQEKTDRENREMCQHIAEELDKLARGNCYRRPHCGAEVDENELEAFTLWEYFNDVFDIEYRVGSDKQYRSVRVMVACGGPNIYIDTAEKAVLLYWWTDNARYCLSSETAEAIDELFKELFNC